VSWNLSEKNIMCNLCLQASMYIAWQGYNALWVEKLWVRSKFICDQACENRACGHAKFDHLAKVSSGVTFNPSLYGNETFTVCLQFIWPCNISYRMKIIYSSNKIWLVKQQGILCAQMPGFCRPSYIYVHRNS